MMKTKLIIFVFTMDQKTQLKRESRLKTTVSLAVVERTFFASLHKGGATEEKYRCANYAG